MPRSDTRKVKSKPDRDFVLGRERFARIGAVEGIALTPEMQAMRERFDRDGLSPEDRRAAILEHFACTR